MELYVQYKLSGDSWRDMHGEGDWDFSWGEENNFNVIAVNTSSQSRKPYSINEECVNVNFEASQGEKVYVVAMIYSTGDTFGSSSGNGEVIWVFKDFEYAKRAAESLKEKEKEYSIDFVDETGMHITLSNPGAGYFERIEQIRVESFIVDSDDSYIIKYS